MIRSSAVTENANPVNLLRTNLILASGATALGSVMTSLTPTCASLRGPSFRMKLTQFVDAFSVNSIQSTR
jgi:peroxiredoxin